MTYVKRAGRHGTALECLALLWPARSAHENGRHKPALGPGLRQMLPEAPPCRLQGLGGQELLTGRHFYWPGGEANARNEDVKHPGTG